MAIGAPYFQSTLPSSTSTGTATPHPAIQKILQRNDMANFARRNESQGPNH
jgi:hypothetical protein